MTANTTKVERYYSDNFLAYQRAEQKVCDEIVTLIDRHGKPYEIRVKLPIESRIKSIKSIIKKIQKRKFSSFAEVRDIVGVKIVVNNSSDVYNVIRILSENMLEKYEHEIDDMIEKPRTNGYRAVHINLAYALSVEGKACMVPVEIQLKTLSQELWSILTHSDIYKQKHEIPAIIRSFTRTLGTLLSVVDEQALEIRSFMEQKITISKELSMNPNDNIDREMVARLIRNEMNYEINDEEFTEIITSLGANKIRTIDLIRKLLKNEAIRNAIDRVFLGSMKRRANAVEYIKYGSIVLFDALKGEAVNAEKVTAAIYNDYDITDERCHVCSKRLEGYEAEYSRAHYDRPEMACIQCLENNFHKCSICDAVFISGDAGVCSKCGASGNLGC